MGLATKAIARVVPKVGDVYTATIGTTASAEVDLFDEFGINDRMLTRGNIYVTIEADAECFIAFGDTGMTAPTSATAKRLAADQPHSFMLVTDRRFMRAIATAADTRLEVVIG